MYSSHNGRVVLARLIGRTFRWRLILALFATGAILSCGGSSTGSLGHLGINPTAMNFGNVTIDHSQTQSGSLTAGGKDLSISAASCDGPGYSLSGLSFPFVVPAGKSVPFRVTFAPQSSGAANGQVSFISDGSNSPTVLNLTGTGSQAVQHSVSLSWNPSTSQVAGYNIYRSTRSGGSYVQLNASLIAVFDFSDDAVQSGTTYYYAATSVDFNGVESPYSNIAIAAIP